MAYSEYEYQSFYEYPKEHPKWHGVPPKGERSLPGKWQYVGLILMIIVIEICIWAVYRYLSAPYFQNFGTLQFYAFHIIFAPTIHLLPIILFWRYLRKERGLPFVFSRKLLMTGIIVGFLAAIIWRVLEEFTWDALAGAADGTVPNSLTFWNLLESPILFTIMTFVHFFIVGPVEELEFRSFTQDQAARVLSNWQALFFSSVLFGCSHIPIAVFVYQFTPIQFVIAMVGWISAGAVFGALYMWSRNIYACIVMHGMGNWQLSVFYFQSVVYVEWIDTTNALVVGTISSLIVNTIMIVFFYIIYKFYWEPHRRGEPAFGGAFMKFQRFLHENDFEKKPFFNTIYYCFTFCIIICGIIMATAHSYGAPDYEPKAFAFRYDPTEGKVSLSSMVDFRETFGESGTLNEGESITESINSSENRYISSISIIVRWTDEADQGGIVRTWENQPDTFALNVTGGSKTNGMENDNVHGQAGMVNATLSFSIEEIGMMIEEEGDGYAIDFTITLVDAGDFVTDYGFLGFTDTENDYTYNIDVTYLVPPQ